LIHSLTHSLTHSHPTQIENSAAKGLISLIRYSSVLPFSALTLLVGRQEGHPVCKKFGVGLMVVTISLELCTTYSSSCHQHFHAN